MSGKKKPPLPRFFAKVELAGECWRWTATKNAGGYGKFMFDGKVELAHRAAYRMFVGPIPAGLDLDHLCRNRWCVNPAHLEPVTRRTNTLRGASPSVAVYISGICQKGHGAIYVTPGGVRRCRECQALNRAKHQEGRNARRRARRAALREAS